jgi:hypothetical protein
MQKTYHGICHCGAVKFEADIDFAQGTNKCNCSYCAQARNWNLILKPAAFRLLSGENAMVAALDDLAPQELAALPVKHGNGRGNKWWESPAVTSHL